VILAGLLKYRAIVLERASAVDALGRPTDSWSQVSSFRCAVEDQGAQELDIGQGPAVSRRFQLRARWQTVQALKVTERHRLVVGARTLNVLAIVDANNTHTEALIDCVQVDL